MITILFSLFLWQHSIVHSSDSIPSLSSQTFNSDKNGDQIEIPETLRPLRSSSSVLISDSNLPPRCNIKTISLSQPYPNERVINTLPTIPIIYKGLSSRNAPLMELSVKEKLLSESGDNLVTLSSSNTYSHDKIQMTLREYIETMNPNFQTSAGVSSDHANETYYLFGNNHGEIWQTFTDLYHLPPCSYCKEAGAVTIGLGGQYSGVSFHYHGPGFAEVIHGSKKFFLYPPPSRSSSSPSSSSSLSLSERYGFYPNLTQAEWFQTIYPTILQQQLQPEAQGRGQGERQGEGEGGGEGGVADDFYECEIFPGDILYFPDQWYHGTLNMAEFNFFVSVFIDPQLIKENHRTATLSRGME
jgi:hypothetical protein